MQKKLFGEMILKSTERFEVGRWLCVYGGFIISLSGLLKYLALVLVYFSDWRFDLLGSGAYLYQITFMKTLNNNFSSLFYSFGQIGWINKFTGGIIVSVIAFYGLKDKEKWAWYGLLFYLIWLSFINHLYLYLTNDVEIFDILSIVFLGAGLGLTHRQLFKINT